MFESWVSDLLAGSLGHFINVQRDKLKVSLWNGVVIENASIREDALDYLDLPFKVQYGCIGQLRLQVPWRALSTSPIVLELSNVTLVMAPREESEWCGDTAVKRALIAKQAELAAAELRKLSARVTEEGGGDGTNLKWLFMSHLWGSLLRRVQLTVQDVHICFQYPKLHSCDGFTFGLTVGGLETLKDQGKPQPIQGRDGATNGEIEKVLALTEVAVYWKATSGSREVQRSDYLLNPVDGCFSLAFQTGAQRSQRGAQFAVSGEVQNVTFNTSYRQLIQMAYFAESVAVWNKRKSYGKFRPEGWQNAQARNATDPSVSWKDMWQYAIKSVLQDLRNLQPGFSLARLKLWQQWRRRYVALYQRQMEISQKEGVGGFGNRVGELQELEAELPTSVVMLFRSIAEEALEEKAEVPLETSSSGSLKGRGWLGWSMSGLWGIMGYTSSTGGSHPIPNPPSAAEISELYEALGFHPVQSSDWKQQSSQLFVSLNVKVAQAHFALRQDHQHEEANSSLLTIGLEGCSSVLEVKKDGWKCTATACNGSAIDWCTGGGAGQSIIEQRKTMDADNEFFHLSFISAQTISDTEKGPHLQMCFNPMKITLRPMLLSKLKSLESQFPTSTQSAWVTRCISLLPTRRARMVAKAQHLAYSQSKLKTEVAVHKTSVCILAQTDSGDSASIIFDMELLKLACNPAKDALDYVRVLRQIEQEHPLGSGCRMHVPSGEAESVLFDDLDRRLLYQQWEVVVHGFSLCTGGSVYEKSTNISVIMDKISTTGNLLVNRMAAERSAAAVQCNWRCSPVKVNISKPQIMALGAAVKALIIPTEDLPSGLENGGGSLVSCVKSVGDVPTCHGLNIDTVLPQSPYHHLGFEVSISVPQIQLCLVDEETAPGHYCIGGQLPCCFSADSHSVNFSMTLQHGNKDVRLSVSKLNVHDTGNYAGKQILANSVIPRLARNICVQEVTLLAATNAEGVMNVSGELDGVEGTAYPGEVAGYLKPSMPGVNAVGKFSFQKIASCQASKLDISLSDACFGSALIMRIAAQFCGSDVSKNQVDASTPQTPDPVSRMADTRDHSFVSKMVSADSVESLTLSLRINNCHAVLPKGAQHMAAVLGVPGGHCALILKVPDLSFHVSFLKGLRNGCPRWKSVEVGMFHMADVILMASTGPHHCLMSPVLEVGEMKVVSSGTLFSKGAFPFHWDQKPRSLNYFVEIKAPYGSIDLDRLEVALCAVSDAAEKMQALCCTDKQVDSEPEVLPDVVSDLDIIEYMKSEDDKHVLEICAPYQEQTMHISIPTFSLQMVQSVPDLLSAGDPCITMLECNMIDIQHTSVHTMQVERGTPTKTSPFQAGSTGTALGPAMNCVELQTDESKIEDTSSNTVQRGQEAATEPLREQLPFAVLEQSTLTSWESFMISQGKILQESTCYYYLAPDGRILEHAKDDEVDLIAGEQDDATVALSLWAPVKVGESSEQLSASLSSAGSFETAGSNLSVSRKSSLNSAGDFYSIEEEVTKSSLESRDWSAARSIDGDYTNIEEFFSDASHTAGHSCDVSTPSSTSRATTETVLLLSIALKDPEKNCSLVHSTVLGAWKSSRFSMESSSLDIHVNIYPWLGTLQTLLEASDMVKQYLSSMLEAEKQETSHGISPSSQMAIQVTISSVRVMIGCLGKKAASVPKDPPFYPCLSLELTLVTLTGVDKVLFTVASCDLSSCWVACDNFSSSIWTPYKQANQLVLMNHMSLEGFLDSGNGVRAPKVDIKMSITMMKMWLSYQCSIPLLLVGSRVENLFSELAGDRGDTRAPQDDSTSARSSFFNMIQQYGSGFEEWSNLLSTFGKLECKVGSLSVLLSDDRSQTNFPLLDANIEHVQLEAKREKNSGLVVWGMELCPMLSVYNRRKMGWEAFLEPWSLKISAESRLSRGASLRTSSQNVALRTILRCISDVPVQLTISPGMLDTICILHELVSITAGSSFAQFPTVAPIGDEQIYKSSFFTTHWLRNETGAAIHFWTKREGVDEPGSSQDMAMLSSPGAGGANGVPLRAVSVSENVQQYGMNKRQMSISELTLARSLDSESQGDTWRSFGSEKSEEMLSLGGSLDCARKSGKLQSVEEMGIQVSELDQPQRMPVEVAVSADGFTDRVNLLPSCGQASFSRHRRMRLYFRLDNQEIACGPVTLDTVGVTSHPIRIADSPAGVHEPEKTWIRAKVICSVTQKSSGGFDVAVHSNAKVQNNTSVTLEVGCWERYSQTTPAVMVVEPGKAVWLPVVTATRGSMCLRPHAESMDPWAMRSAWSQPIDLQQLFQWLKQGSDLGVHCHLKCNPISGGLKPVWLNVGAKIAPEEHFTNIQIEAPVAVLNFLPIPTEVALRCQGGLMLGLKGLINPRGRVQGHTLEGAHVDRITIEPRGYKLAQVDHLQELEGAVVPDTHGILGVICDSTQDTKLAEAIVRIDCDGAGSIPICITHSIEGFTGRHVFELSCALWVYNCTGMAVAIREYEDCEPFVDEEAVRIPDDKVPIRWVPPFGDPRMQEGRKPPGISSPGNISTAHPTSSNPSGLSRSIGEIGGLKDLLQAGDPEKFKIRSGGPIFQPGGKVSSMKNIKASGSKWPWMEVGGAPRQGRLRLQLRASRAQAPKGSDYWSSPLSVDSYGAAGVVQVPCPINAAAGHQSFPAAAYFLAVTSHSIPNAGGAWALHVMPRYILVNQTSVSLQYRQQGIHVEQDLLMGSSTCVQWLDARRPLRLNLRIKEAGWLWSGGISLESPGDMFVKVRHRHREETMLLQVDVNMSQSGVLVAGLSHQLDGFAPYRLDNCTNEKLHVRQDGCREQEDILRPYSSVPYAWDEPAGAHKVVLELAGHRHVANLKLDEVGNTTRVTLQPDPSSPYTNRKRRLRILVVAEGPTRVLVVMDEDLHPNSAKGAFNRSSSHEQLGWHSWSSADIGQAESKSRAAESHAGLEIEVHFSGVGVSFVDARKELLYAWVSEPQLYFALGKVRYTLEGALNRFQLDNCMRDAVYPVLLRGPTSMIVRRQPAITVRSSIWRRRPGGVVCVEQLHLNIAPFGLEIEEAHMREITKFCDAHLMPFISPPNTHHEAYVPDVMVLEDGQAWSQITPKSKVYIESLVVSRTEVTFSFCPASWRLSSQDAMQQKRLGATSMLLQRVLALANVEAAQVSIRALEVQHPLLSQSALFTLVGRHYMRSLVHEIYKIVGSSDFLGDPVRLVHHLGLGVWSLFSNPASAALEETSTRLQIPQRVLYGVLLGLRSLVSNTIYAFTNATAKLSLTARKGLVVLGLEDESRMPLARRGVPRSARLTPTEPFDSGLAEAILAGLAGLLSEPVRGVEEAGLVGLVRGTMRGFVGLLVRPVARSLEMCSRVADSIQVLVSGYPGPMPLMRVPRLVDPAAPLQQYCKLDAVGSLILSEASGGKFSHDVLLICSEAPSRGSFIVVTHRHLLVVSMQEPNSPYSFPEVQTVVPLDEVENVSLHGKMVGLLGIQVFGENLASSPFTWWKIDCGEEIVATSMAAWILYACQHCLRRSKRVGSALMINSRLFVK